MNLGKILLGAALTGSLLFTGCNKLNITGDVDIGEANRGTIVGSVFIYDAKRGGSAGVWLTNNEYSGCKKPPYKTRANSNGDYLFEVPAGAYNIYGCHILGGSGQTSVIVQRGETVYADNLKLSGSFACWFDCGCAEW